MPSQLHRALQQATAANLLPTFENLSQIYVPSEVKDRAGRAGQCQDLLNEIGRLGMQLYPLDDHVVLLTQTRRYQRQLGHLYHWEGIPELAARPGCLVILDQWAGMLQRRLSQKQAVLASRRLRPHRTLHARSAATPGGVDRGYDADDELPNDELSPIQLPPPPRARMLGLRCFGAFVFRAFCRRIAAAVSTPIIWTLFGRGLSWLGANQ